jgi:hypothetical protein
MNRHLDDQIIRFHKFIITTLLTLVLTACGGGSGGGGTNNSSNKGTTSTLNSSAQALTDSEAPIVNLLFPSKQSLTQGSNIIVRGRAKDNASNISYVRVNGVDATSNDNFETWQANINLAWGMNEVSIAAMDSAGNINSAADIFYVKRVPPHGRMGDIVYDSANSRAFILDPTQKAIIVMDSLTGTRKVLSDITTSNSTQSFINPVRMVLDIKGNRILVADDGFNVKAIIAVDLNTGARTLLFTYGNALTTPTGLTLDFDNNRLVIIDSQSVYGLSLINGSVNIISNHSTPDTQHYFTSLKDVALDQSLNRALATDNDSLIEIDLSSGIAKVISESQTSLGVKWSNVSDLVLDRINNRAIVLSAGHSKNQGALIAVDLKTGERTFISTRTQPSTPTPLSVPYHLAMDAVMNRVLVTQNYPNAVIAIDLLSGNHEILSDDSIPDKTSQVTLDWPLSLVANESLSTLYLMDETNNSLFSIARDTSRRHLISFEETNHGTNNYGGMAYDETTHRVLIADTLAGGVLDLNVETGSRSVLSDQNTPGNSAPISWPTGVALNRSNGKLYVSDVINGVLNVNTDTGETAIVSNNTMPNSVNEFNHSSFFAIESERNRALLVDTYNTQVIAIDLSSGARSILSDNSTPDNNIPFQTPVGIVIDGSRNRAIISDYQKLISVDLVNGQRKLLVSSAALPGLILRTFVMDEICNCIFFVDSDERAIKMMDLTSGHAVTFSK